MSAVEQVERLTVDEFVRLYQQAGPFEIIHGERKPIMPPVALHVLTIHFLLFVLKQHCTEHRLGVVFAEVPFVLVDQPDWVKGSRVPDVSFFSSERWAQYTASTVDWEQKPFVLVPDLAVEVVSKNDSYTDIQDKVDEYLKDGVRLIWVVDPQRKRIGVYDGVRYLQLGEQDTLSDSEVIPSFEVKAADVFKLS